MSQLPPILSTAPVDTMRSILDLARWAPSGDNRQEWRFRCVSPSEIEIHYHVDDPSFLNIDGMASHVAFGALLQTIEIAASHYGLRVERTPVPEHDVRPALLKVQCVADTTVHRSPLVDVITARQTSRCLYQTTPLTVEEKRALEHSVGDDYTVTWFEGKHKLPYLRLALDCEATRVLAPEMVDAYRKSIAWKVDTCPIGLPSRALGVNPLTEMAFQHLLKKPDVFLFFQKYLGGSLMAKIELDVLPTLFCGAVFLMTAKKPPRTIEDHLAAGAALQRFLLTATTLSLLHQPNYAPVSMNIYGRDQRHFSQNRSLLSVATRIRSRLVNMLGSDAAADGLVFTGRLGHGTPPTSRSLRLPLDELMIT